MVGPSPPMRLSAILSAVGGDVLRPFSLPPDDVVLDDVVLFGDGDPLPPASTMCLCAGSEIPAARVVVVRAAAAAAPTAADAVVLTIADGVPWLEVYDQVRRCFADHAADAADEDLFTLADTIATAVGGAVAIEDVERRVLAFSTVPGQPIDRIRREGILGRQVPEHVERSDWYRRLWRSQGVVEYQPGPESSARLAIAVRAGGERLGSVWVVGDRSTLSEHADEALHRAVPGVARCLLQQQRFTSRSREARARLLRRLVIPTGVSGDPADALSGESSVVVVAVRQEAPPSDRELLDMRLADLLSLQAVRVHNTGLSADLDGTVYAVLPWVDRPHVEKQLQSVLGRAVHPCRVAVSDVVHAATDVVAAATAAARLLDLEVGTDRQIRYVEDERHRLTLTAIGQAIGDSVREFTDGLAARIRAFDSDNGTQYAATLRAWFDTNGEVTSAAIQLHVHPNTFRYRIARAIEIFDIDFDDADERLLLHLQLRLADQ